MSTEPDRPEAERPAPERAMDRKLAAIVDGSYHPDAFIIADAKDADMAFGATAGGSRAGNPAVDTGADPDAADPDRFLTRPAYLDDMRAIAAQGEIDILLTSASNGERLAADGSLPADVTLAVRANDTTDIWFNRGSAYSAAPSRPFRTAQLHAVRPFCDLVLYSMTFNNDLDHDIATLNAYRDFRREAAEVGMRHFLEVFNPNAPIGLADAHVGAFVNDSIVRALAGVTAAERPLFLKMAYNGTEAMTELARHDPSLVVGILGGSAGTTRDTYELLQRAEADGARVALFGRKIQRSESPLDLVALMRPVLRGELSPADAVKAYHEALAAQGFLAFRSLEDDLEVTEPALRDR